MYVYANENKTTQCVIWEIEDDPVGQNMVNFSVNGCGSCFSRLSNDPDCGELFFVWKEILFYIKDFKEI